MGKRKYVDCVARTCGTTGESFAGALGYIRNHHPAICLLENVDTFAGGVGGNGETLIALVQECGYVLGVVQVSPHRTIMPQLRKRLFYVAIDKVLTTANTLSCMVELVREMEAQPVLLPMDRLLLRDTDPLVKAELDSRQAKTTGTETGKRQTKSGKKWVLAELASAAQQHSTVLGCRPSAWGATKWDTPEEAHLCPWFNTLTTREQHVLSSVTGGLKDGMENCALIDLTQSSSRKPANTNPDVACCITPAALLWHCGRNRLLLGVEKCSLQGLWLPVSVTDSFDNGLISNLAGNAFCGPDFAKVLIAVFVALGNTGDFSTVCSWGEARSAALPSGLLEEVAKARHVLASQST